MNEDKLNTSCKACVFSVFDDNTQTGCELGRIEKFKKQNVVLEVTDNELDHYVIERFCNAYRESAWGEVFMDRDSRVKYEMKPKFGVIIVFENGCSQEGLKKTIESVKNQEGSYAANYYVVVNRSSEIEHYDLVIDLNHILKEEKFFVIKMAEKDVSVEKCIDEGFRNATNGYYLTCISGHQFDSQTIKKIDIKINEKLDRFIAIEPTDGINDMFVQSAMHKILYGNHEKSIIEKLKEVANNEGVENMVITWDEL